MKKCTKCEKTKSLDDFQKKSSSPDGHTNLCKPCKRLYDNAHYKANPHRRSYIRENSRQRREVTRQWVFEYLKTHPCVDCGESDPVVLEFDHRENKIADVSRLVDVCSIKTIKLEIAKCDIRCANCHRRKTAKDFGYWKLNLSDSNIRSGKDERLR